jgi:PIN domain
VTPRVIVLDANILLRAVLGARVPTLLSAFSHQVTFLTPDVAFDDVCEHLLAVLAKRGQAMRGTIAGIHQVL